MKTVKKTGKRLRVFRILGLAFMIAGVIIIANTISKKNQQVFESNILHPTTVAEKQLTQEQINEIKNIVISQNIPIPEAIKQEMKKEAEAKAEAERIAKEQAEAEARAKAEAEEKARLEAEQKAKEEAERQREVRIASTQVTSRGGNISRTSSTKSELQNYARNLCISTYGWSENDVNCLIKLWEKESGWNPNSHNKSSGAHRNLSSTSRF